MAIEISPIEGIYIEKELNVNETENVRKSFKVTNNGESTMYLVYPDLSTVRGIRFIDRPASGRTPDIESGQHQVITIEVDSEYINGFNTLNEIDEQILRFKVQGYTPPPPPPPPTGPRIVYYTMNIEPLDDGLKFLDDGIRIPFGQLQFTVGIRLIAVLDDGTRQSVWPDNGYTVGGIDNIADQQLGLVAQERVGNVQVVMLENYVGSLLDARWGASVRDPKYINQAGEPATYQVRFYSEEAQTNPDGTPTTGNTGGGPGGGNALPPDRPRVD